MSPSTIRAPSAPEIAWSPAPLAADAPWLTELATDAEDAVVQEQLRRRPTPELIAVLLRELADEACALCGEPAATPSIVCAGCSTKGPAPLERQQHAA